MPEYPRYQSKGQITTRPSTFQAVESTEGQMLETVGKVGQVATENALKWQNAVDTIQKTTARANYKAGLADITSRAQSDPNYNNSEQYFREIEKLQNENLKGFSSKMAETEAAIEFGYEGKVAQIQIENLYKKKMIEVGLLSAEKLIDAEISNPSQNSFANIQKILEEQVSSGIMGRKEAYDKYKQSVKTIGEFDVANDPSTEESQSDVLAELRKGDDGRYADIPPDERLGLIKASQQRIFNNNQTFKRDTNDAANERANNFIEKMASGEAGIKDIENELAIPEESGGIKRSVLLTYQRAITSGVKNDLNRMLQEKTQDKEPTKRAKSVRQYLDLIDSFIDNQTDQWKAKELLASAYEDGIVNAGEQRFLNALKQDLKDIEFNRNTGIVASSIRGLKDFFGFQSNATDEDLARNIKGLIGEIQEGATPDQALRRTIQKEVLSRLPDYATYPETGKLKRDANGNIIRVFPDGTYVEEPPKGSA